MESLLASGNLVFDTDGSRSEVESILENAWLQEIGKPFTTVVLTQEDIEALIAEDPFDGRVHGTASYLLVTFYKKTPKLSFDLPYSPDGKTYTVLSVSNRALFTITDNTVMKTTDLMTWLEKQLGKEITSRSWNTMLKIYAKL